MSSENRMSTGLRCWLILVVVMCALGIGAIAMGCLGIKHGEYVAMAFVVVMIPTVFGFHAIADEYFDRWPLPGQRERMERIAKIRKEREEFERPYRKKH